MNKKILFGIMILSLLLSLPSLFYKIKTEQSSPTVEFTTDYLSLVSLDEQSKKSDFTLDAMLKRLKNNGFTSLTLSNNTLTSLESRGLISVLKGEDIQLMNFFSKSEIKVDKKLTYVIALDETKKKEIFDLIQKRFSDYTIHSYKWAGKELLAIDISKSKLLNYSIPFLESDIDFLTSKPYEFSLVLKIDNKWDGKESLMIEQLEKINPKFISKIYFTDAGLLGFPDNHEKVIGDLPNVPYSYKEYFSAIEKQKGIDVLAKEKKFNLVRLHAISEDIIMKNIEEPNVIRNRIVLAVKERNIRTLHIQFPSHFDKLEADEWFNDTLDIVKTSMTELKKSGFSFGISHSFEMDKSVLVTISEWSSIVCAVSLITLLVSLYSRKYIWHTFGLLSLIALSKLIVGQISWQIISLLFAIAIPTFAVSYAIFKLEHETKMTFKNTSLIFILTSILSIIGSLVLVSIHSDIAYILYLKTFKGVLIAHLFPPFLLMIFMIVYYQKLNRHTFQTFFNAPIRIYQAVLVGLVLLGGLYYLSRTGNAGTLIPFEAEFRSLLENTLGVRPRTKEFLFAHPLLLLIMYYWKHIPWVKWLLPIAIIGQISITNTFTHFHTPTLISLTRATYGMILGIVIGWAAISFFEWVIRKYKKKNAS